MLRGVLLVLSLWAVLTAGKVFVLDIDTVSLIPLEAPISVDKVDDIYSNCGNSNDMASIKSLKITPDPPEKGKNLTVTADINLKEQLTGGEVKVKVKYSIITVVNQTVKICDALKDIGKACPLAAGDVQATESVAIPSAAPSGHYTGNIEATDQNGKQLLCIDLDFHL